MTTHKLPFNESELMIIFEAARIAFKEIHLIQGIAYEMDISDESLSDTQKKLNDYMDEGEYV